VGNWIDITVLVLYFAGMLAVAFYTRKKIGTVNDFLLAGKGVNGVMTAFAYGTTYFSAVIFIGYAGKNGYVYGLSSLWIGISNAFIGSLLAWKLLARRTKRTTEFFGARTMPEMFGARYQSKRIKLVCALIIFVFLTPYAASVYQGLAYLFELVFGIPFWAVILVIAVSTCAYLFFGGYLATVLTDFFQGIVMLAGVAVMVGFVVNYEKVGGAIDGFSKLLNDDLGFFPAFAKGEGGAPHGYTLLTLILLTSIGAWGLPQIVHKFHTVKSEAAAKQAAWGSTAFALVIGVCAYLTGCFARYILGAAEVGAMVAGTGGNEDMIIPKILVEALPAGLLGLIVVLVLSASMSTLASLTLAASSAVAVDLYKGYINKNASDKRVKLLMRSLCVLFIAVSVVIAVTRPAGIISLMSLSWGTLAGCFLGPYVYGLYSRRATKKGAYAGIISGLAVNAVLYAVSLVLKGAGLAVAAAYLSPPAIGVAAMLASMLAVPLVSRFTAPPPSEFTDRLFAALTSGSESAEPVKNV
jgi:SSS family transporter